MSLCCIDLFIFPVSNNFWKPGHETLQTALSKEPSTSHHVVFILHGAKVTCMSLFKYDQHIQPLFVIPENATGGSVTLTVKLCDLRAPQMLVYFVFLPSSIQGFFILLVCQRSIPKHFTLNIFLSTFWLLRSRNGLRKGTRKEIRG